jgi:archaemetzincin
VLLLGLGDVPARLLAEVAEALRTGLAVTARAGPLLDRPGYAFNDERRQYHAAAVLRRVSALRAGVGGIPALGIVDGDLFEPDVDHVLGEVDREAQAAVIALTRLAAPAAPLLYRRARVEALHFVGRLLGLPACTDARCPLYPSQDAGDADRKLPGLCASCRALLPGGGGAPTAASAR